MAIQKVVTEEIASAAAGIAQANEQLSAEVNNLRSMASNLLGSWNSGAGAAAQTVFHQVIQGDTARSAVLDNYAAMLRDVVNPSYTNAEEANTKLADLFL